MGIAVEKISTIKDCKVLIKWKRSLFDMISGCKLTHSWQVSKLTERLGQLGFRVWVSCLQSPIFSIKSWIVKDILAPDEIKHKDVLQVLNSAGNWHERTYCLIQKIPTSCSCEMNDCKHSSTWSSRHTCHPFFLTCSEKPSFTITQKERNTTVW